MKPPPGSGVVYFIEAVGSGLVKIGRAKNLKLRLRSLRVGSAARLRVLGTIPTDSVAALEAEIHDRFACARSRGEWFYFTADIRDFIREHTKVERTKMALIFLTLVSLDHPDRWLLEELADEADAAETIP